MRTSRQAWRRLAKILGTFEDCVEACARLDAHRPVDSADRLLPELHAFEVRLGRLQRRVDFEIDQLTAEQLMAGLAARKARI